MSRTYSLELRTEVGLVAVEILSALKSHETVFQILNIKNASRSTDTKDFEAGFDRKNKVSQGDPGTFLFGAPWSEMKVDLARAVFSIIG